MNLTRRVKPQSTITSAKVAIEASAQGVTEIIQGINDVVSLGRDAIASAKANNRREDSIEFAMAKTDDLSELYARVTGLQAIEPQTDLIKAQIATIQKSIDIVSAIEIEYK